MISVRPFRSLAYHGVKSHRLRTFQGGSSRLPTPLLPRSSSIYSGLLGNEKADLTAKTRAERGGRLLERCSSLPHIKKSLTDIRHKETIKWHETKMQEREASRCGYYIPWTRGGISPILGNAPKKYASRYYQLKVGHGAVGTFWLG